MDEPSPGGGDRPPRVSVIIPARDEEATIGRVVAGVRAQLGEGDEVLVVDDGSGDRTAEEAGRSGARVISHPYNIGNGAAVKTGIRQSRGEILVFLDGDGQHDPADIPALLEHAGRYDLVVGARTLPGRGLPHRNLANACYNLLASYIAGRRIPDLTSGFRAVRRRVARRFAYLLPNTFSYPATLTLALLRTGHSVRFVPIRVQRRIGRSKIRLFVDGPRFLIIIFRIAVLFSPLRIFLPVSLAAFLAGLVYYTYTFLAFHRFTNFSLLLLVSSILVFLLGLISEQIAQLRFDRSEDEPGG